MVCISLCAPLSAYGQITFQKTANSYGYGFLEVNSVGVVNDNSLKEVEEEIKYILSSNKLEIINKEFAGRQLPKELLENLKNENLNFGNQYLHGLFQLTD